MRLHLPVELENAVIGCILLKPDCLVDLDWLEATHFGTGPALAAFQAVRNLEASGAPIDFVTVLDRMQRSGEGAASKAEEYLGECIRNVPDPNSYESYAIQLRDEAVSRRVRVEVERVINAPANGADELIGSVLSVLSRIDTGSADNTTSIADLVKRRIKQLEQIAEDRIKNPGLLSGYPTGVQALDDKIAGWQPKIVSIVCARPGMGKSSLGLATADACSAAGFGVHLFSMEDTEEAYADRTMSRTSKVPAEEMRNARLNRGQMTDMTRAIQALQKRPWIIDGRSGITADEIVRSVRKHKRANQTKVAIVDYIQLVKAPRELSKASRHEQLTESVTILADAAKQDDVAYVVMSQLNRGVEQRADKRPMLSDLRESGALEERAKCVVGIYRGAYYGKPQPGVDYDPDGEPPGDADFARQVQLCVIKNSNGDLGSVLATFHGPTTRME